MTTVQERPLTIQQDDPATELEDFPALTERYQRELLAHCYRMSGSVLALSAFRLRPAHFDEVVAASDESGILMCYRPAA